jgi:predicted protein tyrosine phosphatase
MPRLHVCSLELLHETVRRTDASHVLTLMKNVGQVTTPASIAPGRHLKLDFSDIVEERPGEVAPSLEHVHGILDFVAGWDRVRPLVIHCYAGISRSTAAAFIAACALRPDQSEQDIATLIRARSPSAVPNARLIRFADGRMGRNGRMIAAIDRIGVGNGATAGTPFHIDVGDS